MARGRRSGRRTDYTWLNTGDVELAQDLTTSVGTFGSSSLVATAAQTVTRLRGRIGVYLDAAAADESAMILVGIGIFDADQVVAGAAPELFAGGIDDGSWMWQGALYVHSGVGVVAGSEEGQFDRIDIDSKAMRRMKANESIALVHQVPAPLVSDQGGTYDLTWYLHELVGL